MQPMLINLSDDPADSRTSGVEDVIEFFFQKISCFFNSSVDHLWRKLSIILLISSIFLLILCNTHDFKY